MVDDSFSIRRALERLNELDDQTESVLGMVSMLDTDMEAIALTSKQVQQALIKIRESLLGLKSAGYDLSGITAAAVNLQASITQAGHTYEAAAGVVEKTKELQARVARALDVIGQLTT